jgi:hypothetical protein
MWKSYTSTARGWMCTRRPWSRASFTAGQRILDALLAGEHDPELLADLAHWRVQSNRAICLKESVTEGEGDAS